MRQSTSRLASLFKRSFRPPTTAAGERVYAVGDLHGRLDLFRILLKQLEADVGERARRLTRLVLLGDLIDRGPHSRELLGLVKRLQAYHPDRVVVLAGNHEDMLIASVDGHADAQRLWMENGGDATLKSYGLNRAEFRSLTPRGRGSMLREAIGADMLDWIRALPLSFRSADYFFCHAGVRPKIPLNEQRREDLLWIRRDFLESKRSHGAVVVHGHSETDVVEVWPNRINVDTCAYRSGQLTAVGLEGSYRWFISTKERYLHRADLDAALTAGTPPGLASH